MFQFLLGLIGIFSGLSISFYKIMDFSKNGGATFENYENGMQATQRIIIKYSRITSIVAFVLGVIAFIAPTPTGTIVEIPVTHTVFVTQRFFGDLIPSFFIICSAIILNPKILKTFKIWEETFAKVQTFLEKYKFLIGILTIAFSFLHWIVGSSVLF